MRKVVYIKQCPLEPIFVQYFISFSKLFLMHSSLGAPALPTVAFYVQNDACESHSRLPFIVAGGRDI